MFANLIFDLDGTLIDSLPGIEASLRAAIARCQPGLALASGALRPHVGPPLAQIVSNLWPTLAAAEVADVVRAYREHYLAESCARVEAFPGVAAALETFHAAGKRLFLLTNKPATQADCILRQLGWRAWFEEVSCPDDPAHPFNDKPEGALGLRERKALAPAETVLIGDAQDDVRAAAAAGFAFVGARYGYGGVGHGISSSEGARSIGAFAELAPLLDHQPPAAPDSHDHPQRLR
jgi:phosphoglycolate phosphatase